MTTSRNDGLTKGLRNPKSDEITRPLDLAGARIGRYQILAHIESGGMASVYLGRALGDYGFERLVAMKRLHTHLSENQNFVEMFVDEACMAAAIRHPKVVATQDVIRDSTLGIFLVMDYVEGQDMHLLIRALRAHDEQMPVRIAARLVLDLLEGLHAAHAHTGAQGEPMPIVHRDVSPHNLLVGADGFARLSDFGIARADTRLTHTRTGEIKGKLAYMAPERLYGDVASARSDIFAAGAVFWESLAGARLFRGENDADTLRQILDEPIPDVGDVVHEAAHFDVVLRRALARRPEERFVSAFEFASAIENVAVAHSGIATPQEVGALIKRMCGEAIERRATHARRACTLCDVLCSKDVGTPSEPEPADSRAHSERDQSAKEKALGAVVDLGLATSPMEPQLSRRPRGYLASLGVAAALTVFLLLFAVQHTDRFMRGAPAFARRFLRGDGARETPAHAARLGLTPPPSAMPDEIANEAPQENVPSRDSADRLTDRRLHTRSDAARTSAATRSGAQPERSREPHVDVLDPWAGMSAH